MSAFVIEVNSIPEAKKRLAAARKLFEGIKGVVISLEARGYWIEVGFENEYPFGELVSNFHWEPAHFKAGKLRVRQYDYPVKYVSVSDKISNWMKEAGYREKDILENPPRLRIRVEQR